MSNEATQLHTERERMKYFKVKSESHRWWHWIIRPIKTHCLMKYLKRVETEAHAKLDSEGLSEFFVDSAVFGRAVFEIENE